MIDAQPGPGIRPRRTLVRRAASGKQPGAGHQSVAHCRLVDVVHQESGVLPKFSERAGDAEPRGIGIGEAGADEVQAGELPARHVCLRQRLRRKQRGPHLCHRSALAIRTGPSGLEDDRGLVPAVVNS